MTRERPAPDLALDLHAQLPDPWSLIARSGISPRRYFSIAHNAAPWPEPSCRASLGYPRADPIRIVPITTPAGHHAPHQPVQARAVRSKSTRKAPIEERLRLSPEIAGCRKLNLTCP